MKYKCERGRHLVRERGLCEHGYWAGVLVLVSEKCGIEMVSQVIVWPDRPGLPITPSDTGHRGTVTGLWSVGRTVLCSQVRTMEDLVRVR